MIDNMLVKKYEYQSFGDEPDEHIIEEIVSNQAEQTHPDMRDNLKENFESSDKVSKSTQNLIEEEINNTKILNEQLLSIFNNINAFIESSIKNSNEKVTLYAEDLSKLTIKIAKKIAIKALEENPLSEIEIFFKDSFKFFKDENDIKIILNPDMIEPVKNKIEELHPEFIKNNNISFESDVSLDKYNCRINWHDGSLILDKDEIIKKIESFF